MNSDSKKILTEDIRPLDMSDHDKVIEWFLTHVDHTTETWFPEDELADELVSTFREAGYDVISGEFSPEHTNHDVLYVFKFAEWIIGRILDMLQRQHALMIEWLDQQVVEYRRLFDLYG
jgi:hypothetical protein